MTSNEGKSIATVDNRTRQDRPGATNGRGWHRVKAGALPSRPHPRQDDDRVFVDRCRNGDSQAFAHLVQKHQQKLLTSVTRIVRNRPDAQDIVQQAFIKAYRALPNFRGHSTFSAWLYRIARNTAFSHLKFQTYRRAALEEYGLIETSRLQATPEDLVRNLELVDEVVEAIARLPIHLRDAISLRELDDLTYEEIADALDIPVGTVRSKIFRARKMLRDELDSLFERRCTAEASNLGN